MPPSISSRTAYVLLWAVEEDLRNLIQLHAGSSSALGLFGETLLGEAAKRRQRDKRIPTEVIAGLLPYIDFQDSFDVLMRIKAELPPDIVDNLQRLNQSAGQLTLVRNRVAHNRPLEIEDLPTVLDFVESL